MLVFYLDLTSEFSNIVKCNVVSITFSPSPRKVYMRPDIKGEDNLECMHKLDDFYQLQDQNNRFIQLLEPLPSNNLISTKNQHNKLHSFK